MKRYKFLSIAALVISFASCSESEKDFDATGTFEATEVTISAETTGTLLSFNVSEGKEVQGNSEVGRIDGIQLELQKGMLGTNTEQLSANDSQLAASADGLTANIGQLQATKAATESRILDLEKQVASLRQQITNTRSEQQRFSELVRDGAVAQKQLADINYQLNVLEKQLIAAEEQQISANESLKHQAEAIEAQMQGIDAQRIGINASRQGIEAQKRGVNVQRAKLDDQIKHTRILSPITGTVLEKYVEQGEYVSIGKPLFKVADIREMYLRAYVTSAQLQRVKIGQNVRVFANYGAGTRKEYSGVVAWISDQSEFTPKTILTDDERADLVYAVKIKVRNDGYIKIGMYGEVKL